MFARETTENLNERVIGQLLNKNLTRILNYCTNDKIVPHGKFFQNTCVFHFYDETAIVRFFIWTSRGMRAIIFCHFMENEEKST